MGAIDQGITPDRWTVIPRTLCFITHGDDLLLMERARHKRAFPGMYNGIGGHIERNEAPAASALREIREETGLTVQNLTLRGISHIDSGQSIGIMLFIFTAESDSREVVANDEGTLHWVPLNELGTVPLVEDLPLLLPRLYGEKRGSGIFDVRVYYDASDHMVMEFQP
jgi:8-oxo-dGTP diphosphatase